MEVRFMTVGGFFCVFSSRETLFVFGFLQSFSSSFFNTFLSTRLLLIRHRPQIRIPGSRPLCNK